jgi:hypothetical protein
MQTRTTVSVAAAAAALCASSAVADILLSDFSNFQLSGTYVDWDAGTFTSGPDSFRVEATNFGGGWLFMDAPIDASGETTLEIVVTANPNNVTSAFNVVLFSDNGTTQAGFTFNIVQGTQTLTADLMSPDFFNAGDINTWNPANLWDQWHLQGTFQNADPLDLTFDNLALIPAPLTLAPFALAAVWRRRRA